MEGIEQMRFYVENFGCQMNEQDATRMTQLLLAEGHSLSPDVSSAEVVVVNTCCVREKAEQKFYSLMGRLERAKKRRRLILGVTGCIAQLEKDEILKRLPFVDFSLGPSGIHRIAEAVKEAKTHHRTIDVSEEGCPQFLNAGTAVSARGGVKAFVTIMKGCDNFCSYCIVPYVRGREMSRPSADVLKEVAVHAAGGVKEVTLLGQNVNSYNNGSDDLSFPQLLDAVNGVEGIERIRFVTSHPKDLSGELIERFGSLPKLCEQIHLPFQAGSDRVLALMNRRYTAGEYVEKVEALRRAFPGIALTADCIVGFPQETEDDFRMTVDLVEKIQFDGLFSFAYSPRTGTKAAGFPGAVPREESLERLRYLQKIQKGITLRKNMMLEGTVEAVLVEERSKNSPLDVMGRTRRNKVVNFEGSERLIGTTVNVRIVCGYANSLRGQHEPEGGRS